MSTAGNIFPDPKQAFTHSGHGLDVPVEPVEFDELATDKITTASPGAIADSIDENTFPDKVLKLFSDCAALTQQATRRAATYLRKARAKHPIPTLFLFQQRHFSLALWQVDGEIFVTDKAGSQHSLFETVSEMKRELKNSLRTQTELFMAELRENSANLKAFGVLVIAGALTLGTAYLLLTMALVSLVMTAFVGNPYRWCFAFLLIGVVWIFIGGGLMCGARPMIRQKRLIPMKTIETLRDDKLWLQHEANHL